MEIKGKRVLLMGLGILGGGVASARWLVEHGAILTITDMKNREDLKPSLEKLGKYGDKIKYRLGRHEEKDFLENEIIVVNPDVPITSQFLEIARKNGKQIENELTLFYKFAPCKQTVGITGTRGKTTTTNWIGHILKSVGKNVLVLGNDPEKPFLSEINKCLKETIAVLETPSFQLEIFDDSGLAPHVAVITNLYQDHLSRHKTMESYALTKANIFKNQTAGDFLVLNKENEWTKFFLERKPKGKVAFSNEVSLSGFSQTHFSEKYGAHNLQNFFAAASACKTLGISEEDILKAAENLPQIKFREEKVFENGNLSIYNDTTATSPDALVASMKRFLVDGEKVVFISGGTDRELDYKKWSEVAQKLIRPENLILLSGSATEKMKNELGWDYYKEFDNLEECFNEALETVKTENKAKIIFSPGAKSFEKFKNEFDRGEKFNDMVKSTL